MLVTPFFVLDLIIFRRTLDMRRILVLGAGRMSSTLIDYLVDKGPEEGWQVRVADVSEELALKKVRGYANATAVGFDASNTAQLGNEVEAADLVISLLPVSFHVPIATACLTHRRSLLTASYATRDMNAMHEDAVTKGVLLLNECGLDPGLDHMTAMAALDSIRLEQKGTVDTFISYTGGLIAPESDNNPWHYKFTWNPRNVVLAGKETAQFIRNGRYKYIPYHRVFTRLDPIQVTGYGDFEGYPNRDSLKYRELYGLQAVETMIRGTLRRPGFCQAWNVLVQLGLTDDSYHLEDLSDMTFRDFINTFLFFHPTKSVEDKLCDYLQLNSDGEIMEQLRWLGIFEKRPVGLDRASPAKILQRLLEEKWCLNPDDKDMIVMQHQIGYSVGSRHQRLVTSLVVTGDDHQNTAMSKTVGYPLAIAAKLVLTNKIDEHGVRLPIRPCYYQPIISEMQSLGVKIIEDRYSSDS